MFGRLFAAIILSLIAALVSPALAQVPSFGAQPTIPTIPKSLASPRATLSTYFDGMNGANIAVAVTTLDLQGVNPLERAERGPQLAYQLFAILNREAYVDLDRVSDTSDAPAFQLPITLQGKEIGKIVIDKSSDGTYRFTPATLAALDGLWDRVQDKPVVHGLEDPDEEQFNPARWAENQMPESIKTNVLGVAKWKWFYLIILLLLGAVAGLAIRGTTLLLVRKIFKLKKQDAAYKGIHLAGNSILLIVLSGLVFGGYRFLVLPGVISGIINIASRTGVLIGFTLLAFSLWDGLVHFYVWRSADKSDQAENLIAPMLSRLGKATIVIIAGLTLLSSVGINVTGFVATLGVGGLVLAFAAKDSVENLFGSVMVLVEKPFKIGDWIRVADVDGEVEEIRLRSTRIRTFEDSVIVLPNSILLTKGIENFGMRRYRRLRTTIGVTYDTPPDKLDQFTNRIREMLFSHPHIWNEKRLVYFNDFAASSLNILVYCFIMATNWQEELEIRNEILLQIIRIADEMEVEFAFPTQVVRVKENDAAKLPYGGIEPQR